MATPNEAPMDRKKVAPEVATPRSWYETAFCTMSTNTCMTRPIRAEDEEVGAHLAGGAVLVELVEQSRPRA